MAKPKTLNKAELKRVLNYNDAHERYRERNRAMILLTHLCGMRIGEVVNLKVSDVIDYNNKVTYEDSSITDPKERETHFWQKDHVRLYGLDYPKRLEKAGFKVDVFDPKNALGEIDYEKLRLNSSELIFIARK